MKEIEQDLTEFGDKCVKNIHELHLECEQNPPKLENFDPWVSLHKKNLFIFELDFRKNKREK